MKQMKTVILLFVLAAVLGLPGIGRADVVGYTKVAHPGNTDIFVSVPFTTQSEGTLTVTNVVSGTGVDVAGPLTAGAFDGVYYVRFTSGSAKGQWSTITSNTTTRLNLEVTSFLSSVANGDKFEIYRHQTLDSVFPDGFEGLTFKASPTVTQRLTEVLVPSTAVGINKSAPNTYYYKGGDWRRNGSSPTAVFNDVVLPPQTYFIIRNNTPTAMVFYALGKVHAGTLTGRLPLETVANDVARMAGNSLPITLVNLHLGGTSAFVTSVSVTQRRDQIFVFDNAVTGINKSASATYYYLNGAWRKTGQPATVSFDNEVLPAGTALLIRKYQAASTGSVDWTQTLSN